MSKLTEEQREKLAEVLGRLRLGARDGADLVAVVAQLLAASWEAGYRTNRGTVEQAIIDLHNPYKREAS